MSRLIAIIATLGLLFLTGFAWMALDEYHYNPLPLFALLFNLGAIIWFSLIYFGDVTFIIWDEDDFHWVALFVMLFFSAVELPYYYFVLKPSEISKEIEKKNVLFKFAKIKDTVETFLHGLDTSIYNDSTALKFDLSKFKRLSGPFAYCNTGIRIFRTESEEKDIEKLRYVLVEKDDEFQYRVYNSTTSRYEFDPLGSDKYKGSYTETKTITTYKTKYFVFDLETKKCVYAKIFYPDSLKDSYEGSGPFPYNWNCRYWLDSIFVKVGKHHYAEE